MKNDMLVLLNRLDPSEDWLSQVREIAVTHGIAKVYLARVTPPFSSRVQSRVAPALLDMMGRMSATATSKYLSKIADDLRKQGVDAEPISTGMTAKEMYKFIKDSNIVLIVATDREAKLYRWHSGGLTERHLQFIWEHVFGPMLPTLLEQFHGSTTRGQRQRPRKAEHREENTK